MASASLSSSSSSSRRYSWQQTSSFSSSSHYSSTNSISFISLSSFPSSSPPLFNCNSKESNNSKRFVRDTKMPADNFREKAILMPSPQLTISYATQAFVVTNTFFKRLFRKQSLWRRIFFTSKKVRSILLLNVVTLVYASDIPVLKEVEEVMDPATFNVIRFTVSALPFLPAAYRARNDARIFKAGAELGLWVSLGYLLQAFGLRTSDAGRASFISVLTVIVVPLLDGMLGAVIPPLTWFGAIMSFVGVAMLESSGSRPDVGDLFNFLSAIFFGVHMLRTEKISRTTRKENFIPLLGYEVCVVAFSSMIWFFFGGCFGESQRPWTWELFLPSLVTFPWIPAVYTGVLSTGLCLWIEMAAMQDVSATETAIIYGLEPVWGAGFAWFLLGERWGTTGWIGAALILGGSVTVQLFGSLPSMDSEDRER